MKEFLKLLLDFHVLSERQSAQALGLLLSEDIYEAQIAAFLSAIQMRGIHPPEFAGFQKVLGNSGIKVDLQTENLIDVCGTGGDGKNTFNISTLCAFVIAGAGFKVAKHGNFSATSGCGSSDVLAFLGVEFTNDVDKLTADLQAANICYLHAPLFQPGLKKLAGIRREIGFRTFFNLLGPVINPAKPKHQFIGVAEPSIQRLYRYFYEDGEVNFAIVHSRDGHDEISLTGAFDVATNNGMETYYPEDFGFERVSEADLYSGSDIDAATEIFIKILHGQGTKSQNQVVIANAAFAIRLTDSNLSFEHCRTVAERSLLSGLALESFNKLTARNDATNNK